LPAESRERLRSKGALTMDELAIAYLIFTFPFGWLLQIARIMLLFGDGDPFSPPESMIYLLFNVFIWYEILKGVM